MLVYVYILININTTNSKLNKMALLTRFYSYDKLVILLVLLLLLVLLFFLVLFSVPLPILPLKVSLNRGTDVDHTDTYSNTSIFVMF